MALADLACCLPAVATFAAMFWLERQPAPNPHPQETDDDAEI